MSPKRRIYFIFGFYVIFLAFIFGASYFSIPQIRKSASDFLATKSEILSIEAQRKSLEESRDLLLKHEKDISEIEKIYLGDEEIPTFIETLEKVAALTDNLFKIEYIAVPGQKEKALNFRLTLWGKFYGILKFLAHIENVPFSPYRLIRIEGLTMRQIDPREIQALEGVEPGDIVAAVDIKIYTK